MGARLFCNSMPLYMLFRLGEIPFPGLPYLENSYAIYYKTGLKRPGSEACCCLPVMVPVCPSSTSTHPHRLCLMHQEMPMPPDFSPDSAKESHQGENKRQDEEEAWIVTHVSPHLTEPAFLHGLTCTVPATSGSSDTVPSLTPVGLGVRSVPHVLDPGCLSAP